ncbi:hypothetical protein GCM10011410_25840 [Hoyosella rhizosphaerae]|uniref:Uncharacterized protein n=1 Tax=Hoyosella rhizosphaerae TaxID=1755582 RepID=A0A916UGG6_9ACTN|nr:hypothetical protein GCM10011410_25840 [Hoyosella rhizosphaerae]
MNRCGQIAASSAIYGGDGKAGTVTAGTFSSATAVLGTTQPMFYPARANSETPNSAISAQRLVIVAAQVHHALGRN